MGKVHYSSKENSKKISILEGPSVLESLSTHLNTLDFDKVIVVTDSNVKNKCFAKLEPQLNGLEYKVFSFTAGESSKTLNTYELLSNQILDWGVTKRSLLIAFGGGVVGNLAGFLAATLLRGIKLLHIPTTVMAMADSTTGGKQGVNTTHGKNLLGTFYEPEFILIDYSLLETLTNRQICNGIAECIKHALCQSEELLTYITQQGAIEKPELKKIITSTIQLKLKVLQKDPLEQNVGKILIYGHTIGHAVEFLSKGELLHGEAISIGMCFAAKLANKLGLMSYLDVAKHYQAFKAWNLPTTIPKEIDDDSILEILQYDKKHQRTRLEFALLESIGIPYLADGSYSLPVELSKVKTVLREMR